MDNSIYVALSSQIATANNVDVTSNNMANANSAGFKEDMLMMSSFGAKDIGETLEMPDDITTISNFEVGSFKQTGRALDVAINGKGFFMIQTPLGVRYTRKGSFLINANNVLVNAKGEPVLSQDGDEIIFEEGDQELHINDKGLIFAKGEQRGILGVVNFENLKLLRKAGDGNFISDIPPEAAEDYSLSSGMLEESNTKPILAVTKLIDLQRNFSINSGVISDTYSMHRNAYKSISKQGA